MDRDPIEHTRQIILLTADPKFPGTIPMHIPNEALEDHPQFESMIVEPCDMTTDVMTGHRTRDVGQWMSLYASTQVEMMSLMLPLVHEQVDNRIQAL